MTTSFSKPLGFTEKRVLTFDFRRDLAAGEVLAGDITVSFRLLSGNDASPQDIANGSPAVDETARRVFVPVQGRVRGANYEILVTVPTSNPKKVLSLAAVLSVR